MRTSIDATLTGANFTGAEVRGATSLTRESRQAQLYSTASYQAHDLTGIDCWHGNNLAGVNLAGQNLTNATSEAISRMPISARRTSRVGPFTAS